MVPTRTIVADWGPPALVRDFMTAIVQSDFDAARALSNDLVKFLPQGQLRHALLRLVDDRQPLVMSSGLCFTTTSSEAVMARCLEEAKALRELSGNHETLVLVDVEDVRHGQSWCSREIGGFAYVKFASSDLEHDPSVIRHELAHALVFARHRFLDEGFAIAAQRGGSDGELEATSSQPTLRALLFNRGDAFAGFDWSASSPDGAICDLATAFVGDIGERLGWRDLAAVLHRIGSEDDLDCAALVENLLGLRLEAVEAGIRGLPRKEDQELLEEVERRFQCLRSDDGEKLFEQVAELRYDTRATPHLAMSATLWWLERGSAEAAHEALAWTAAACLSELDAGIGASLKLWALLARSETLETGHRTLELRSEALAFGLASRPLAERSGIFAASLGCMLAQTPATFVPAGMSATALFDRAIVLAPSATIAGELARTLGRVEAMA